jgi:hypothetical protein
MIEPTEHMVEAVDRALTAAAGTGTGEARAAAALGELSALFRMTARGRRQYLRSIEGDERFGSAVELLRIEITTIESVARVIEGELGPLYDWLPSHLWTKEMLARLYAVHPADDAAPNNGSPSSENGEAHG